MEQQHPAAGVAVHLARHEIRLPDGREVGVCVAGWGVPLVVINGFTAEGILYAQTTSRLVSMGFKVIAIDTPGHGRSAGLRNPLGGIESAAAFVASALDTLGIGAGLILGHSTGGRIAVELAAMRPDLVTGLVLVDAIVGRIWDDRIRRLAVIPGYSAKVAVETGVDVLRTTVDWHDGAAHPDVRQLGVLARSLTRSGLQQASRPWRMLSPGGAILTAPSSRRATVRVRALGIPTVVLHGDRDGLVPLAVGAGAADELGCPLVVVEGGGHFWCLQDPEVLPGIVGGQLAGGLGDAYAESVRRAGLDPASATVGQIETAAYRAGAPIRAMTPAVAWERGATRRRARLSWHVEHGERAEHLVEPVLAAAS